MKIKNSIVRIAIVIVAVFSIILTLSVTKEHSNIDAKADEVMKTSQPQERAIGTAMTLESTWMDHISENSLNQFGDIVFLNNPDDDIVDNRYMDDLDLSNPTYIDEQGLKFYNYYNSILVIYNDTFGPILAPADCSNLFNGDRIVNGVQKNYLKDLYAISFNNVFKVTSATTNMESMFEGLEDLKAIDSFEGWDTSNVTNFNETFKNNTRLKMLELRDFDTSSATTMIGMFQSCTTLRYLDVEGIDTSNVNNFTNMFSGIAHASSAGILHELDLSSFTIKTGAITTSMFGSNPRIQSIITPKSFGRNVSISLPGTYYSYSGSYTNPITSVNASPSKHVFLNNSYNSYTDMEEIKNYYRNLVENNTYTSSWRRSLNMDLTNFWSGASISDEDMQKAKESLDVKSKAVTVTFWTSNFSDSTKTIHYQIRVQKNYQEFMNPGTRLKPKKAGKLFDYWAVMKDGYPTKYTFGSQISKDLDLYANWADPTNTVTFFLNYDGATSIIKEVNYRGKLDRPTDPIRTGYHFRGWFRDFQCLNEFYFDVPIVADMTLFAKWEANEYEMTLNIDGANLPGHIDVTYDSLVVFPTDPTKVGYTFLGWSKTSGGAVVASSYTYDIAGNSIFYAVWQVNTYQVTFETNGGNSVGQITATYGQILSTKPADPTKAGYRFVGWFNNSSLTGTATDFDTYVYNIAGPTTFYAKWSQIYTLSFNSNGATTTPGNVNVEFGDSITKPVVTKTGYTFGGWFKDSNFGGTAIDFTTYTYDFTSDTVFHAKWTANSYTLTFNDNNGNETDVTVAYDANIKSQVPAATNKTGYLPGGWFKDSNFGGTAINFDTYTYDVVGDTTFYLKWDAQTYVLTLKLNNGEDDIKINATYDAKITPTPTDPIRIGFTFSGWFRDSTLTGSAIDFTSYTYDIAGNAEFHAKWIPLDLTVKFETYGGTEIENVELKAGNKVSKPATDPTKIGYDFKGWVTTDGGAIAFDFDLLIVKNTTIYAKWEVLVYTNTLNTDTGITLTSKGDISHDSVYTLNLSYAIFYKLGTIKITMNNAILSESDYSVSGNTYTISAVKGDIVVTVTSINIKDEAKEELEDYHDDLKGTPGLNEDQLQNLESAKDTALGNVDSAMTPEGAQAEIQLGKVAMDEVILDAYKEAAKDELQDYYDELVTTTPDLSKGEKEDLEEALNNAFGKVEEEVSKNEVDAEVVAGKLAMDNLMNETNYLGLIAIFITIGIGMISIVTFLVIRSKYSKA